MKAGPKGKVDETPLPMPEFDKRSEAFRHFAATYVNVPKGTGAGGRLRLRDWQVDLVSSILDPDPQPRLGAWMMPRGQGKTTLLAALGLFDLFTGAEGANVDIVATDERQAMIALRTAHRMVELEPELADRAHLYQKQLRVPARGALMQLHSAEPKHLEGLDPSFAIVDEVGVVDRRVWEVMLLAAGKRDSSICLGIGTPGPDPDDSVLLEMREYGLSHPDDATFIYREHSAAAFLDHPVDCEHCWELANPALDDFLHRDALRAMLPPKTRESTYRRARLCQFVTDTDGRFLPSGLWDTLGTGEPIKDGAKVVLALDGSFNGDATALVAATVSRTPHLDVIGLWEPPKDDPDYRVPVMDVEAAIHAACKQFKVVEVTADPYRWTRSLQALEADGVPVSEFPQSATRMGAATSDFYKAALSSSITHSGNERLARHITNAVVTDDARGVRLRKDRRNGGRIDLAVAALMALSRASWHAKKKSKTARSFA